MPTSLYDMHTHSLHSFDGEETVNALCKAALNQGLAGIAITDHVDFGRYLTPDWEAQLTGSLDDAKSASQSHFGRLDVLCGIELGQPLQDLPKAEQTLLQCDFDVVVMALHNTAHREDYYFLDYTALDIDALLREYFEELHKMAYWSGFDVLAHMGYPLRYVRQHLHIDWDMAPYADMIDAILAEVADAGKALEINTSGPNRGAGYITADLRQLRRFRELGGVYVTLGSDAHKAQYVGGCFAEGVELLQAAGFDFVAHYKARKPMMTRI